MTKYVSGMDFLLPNTVVLYPLANYNMYDDRGNRVSSELFVLG